MISKLFSAFKGNNVPSKQDTRQYANDFHHHYEPSSCHRGDVVRLRSELEKVKKERDECDRNFTAAWEDSEEYEQKLRDEADSLRDRVRELEDLDERRKNLSAALLDRQVLRAEKAEAEADSLRKLLREARGCAYNCRMPDHSHSLCDRIDEALGAPGD